MLRRVGVGIRSDASWVAGVVCLAAAWTAWKLVTGQGAALETMAPTVGLVTYSVVLGACAADYCHWRLSSADHQVDGMTPRLSAWLVVGTAIGALPQILVLDLRYHAAPGGTAGDEDSWLLVSQLVIILLLVLFTRASDRLDVPGDPGLLGVVAGLVLTAATAVVAVAGPQLVLGSQETVALVLLLLLAGPLLGSTLLQKTDVSLAVRRRLALAAVALVAAQALGHVTGPVPAGTAIVLDVLGALVLCATALRLLRDTLQEYRKEVAVMHSVLHEQEVVVLEQRELLHELGSTLAGIASASEIIRGRPHLPALRRRRLERMLDAEVSRLLRLMGDRAPCPVSREVDVDDVVGTIVLSHQTRGRDIRWEPSGLTAVGCADDLAEVMNILLENAASHGRGAPVSVTATSSSGTVQIVCSDLGPGVPPELRSQLFETGVRHPGSPGQGLGLSIARRLVAEQGGSLVFRPALRGATFEVRIPEQVNAHGMRHGVVHAS